MMETANPEEGRDLGEGWCREVASESDGNIPTEINKMLNPIVNSNNRETGSTGLRPKRHQRL